MCRYITIARIKRIVTGILTHAMDACMCGVCVNVCVFASKALSLDTQLMRNVEHAATLQV